MRFVRTTPFAVLLVAAFGLACAVEPVSYDLVLAGGRVMDPETGLDAVMDVGISGGTVRAISPEGLEGTEVVDVSGHVVAPGFVDLHAHGHDPFSRDLQARDGVTAAFELEGGAYPVDEWYEEREGSWRIHFGATVAYGAPRSPTVRRGCSRSARTSARRPTRRRAGSRSRRCRRRSGRGWATAPWA